MGVWDTIIADNGGDGEEGNSVFESRGGGGKELYGDDGNFGITNTILGAIEREAKIVHIGPNTFIYFPSLSVIDPELQYTPLSEEEEDENDEADIDKMEEDLEDSEEDYKASSFEEKDD
ncbi:hypothetical protein VNO77_02940 [Canavalia gladiata]|uniref:Uncharacterized protein n=1 Tax=Canavalia gladiata TaxID=3824 RepID=A0AAN9MZ33_CANGL